MIIKDVVQKDVVQKEVVHKDVVHKDVLHGHPTPSSASDEIEGPDIILLLSSWYLRNKLYQ